MNENLLGSPELLSVEFDSEKIGPKDLVLIESHLESTPLDVDQMLTESISECIDMDLQMSG